MRAPLRSLVIPSLVLAIAVPLGSAVPPAPVPRAADEATSRATANVADVAGAGQAVAPSRAVNVPLAPLGVAPSGGVTAPATTTGTGVFVASPAVVSTTDDGATPVAPETLDSLSFPAADDGRVLSQVMDGSTFQDVGLTWPVGEDGAALEPQVRVRANGQWSGWTSLGASDESPDAGSADAKRSLRDGTDLLWVGDVQAIQLSVRPSTAAPGAELALVGAPQAADGVAPAVYHRSSNATVHEVANPVSTVPIDMITRAQWGAAPEACQPDVASGLVGAVVHHTATRNDYTTVAQAEQDIRNIQAYHISSRGWCDIGYNFIVDKWGNLYEGRAHSLEQPVIGVHTGGFNTGTVGVAMLGTYSTVTPSQATVSTVAEVIGVRLGVYGIDPRGSMSYTTGVGENSRYLNQTVVLPRVFGHRDVAYTECPGDMGYAQLPAIRIMAAERAVGLGPCPDTVSGYWLVASDGGVFAFCAAGYYGSTSSIPLSRPVVTAARTPSGHGYWLVASDGGVFSFGDAAFYGSTGAIRLNKPIVTAMATPSGHGYWLVASDGGVFSFGDAAFYGSTGAIRLNKPIVTAMATPSGHGYWLVASDGGIFTFGDGQFYGSTGAITLNSPIVGGASDATGTGYWLVAADGGVFSFGSAQFLGSVGSIPLSHPVIGMVAR